MSIAINSNFERDQYQAAANQVQFNFSFPIFSEDYLTVYLTPAGQVADDLTQQLVLGVDYSVTGVGQEAGGFILLVVPASAGDIITLVGTEPIERESVFEDYNPFTVALNQQLNEQTVMAQQTYTYWNHMTPHYNFSELVNDAVRPQKRILPMLPDGHVWVGRGSLGTNPDDIITQFIGSGGIGNVVAAHPTPMNPSIAVWTGTDFQLDDSAINISGNLIDTTPETAGDVAGFTDNWGAIHIPNQPTTGRPSSPTNGDIYYDTTQNAFYAYINGLWQQLSTGGGGGGGNQIIINQTGHGLVAGNWVRITNGGLFVKAQADTAQDAEVAGLVINVINANQFTLQTEGYMNTAGAFVGLTVGAVYFLSDVTAGLMQLTPPTLLNEINKPLFIAYTTTTGFIRNYRGFVNSGAPASGGGGGGGGTSPSIVTIHQVGHGLSLGNVVRLAGSIDYVVAQADSFTHAQAVGVVIDVIDADNFKLQTEGYNVGAITQDDMSNPLVPASAYYLSPTVAGAVTATAPSSVGQAIKPILYCEQAGGSPAGYILPQFPAAITTSTTNPNIVTVTQTAHGFSVADWLYISGSITYSLAVSTSLATSQAVGVVIAVLNANQFVLQTEGYVTGVVGVDDASNPVVASTIYYISSTVAGAITGALPTDPNIISKPVYSCEQEFGVTGLDAGYILPQRPLANAATNNQDYVTIVQTAHGFSDGTWLYISDAKIYSKAISTTLPTSFSVGVVVNVIDVNTFVLQTGGYNIGAITVDDASAVLVPGAPYYLSSSSAGKIHNAPPAVGLYSQLCYMPEQTTGDGGKNAGYILPPQPQLVTSGGGGGGLGGLYIGAWVIFNGQGAYSGNAPIIKSFNITNILRNASTYGWYIINFTTPLANSTFITQVISGVPNSGSGLNGPGAWNSPAHLQTTSQLQLFGGAGQQSPYIQVIVWVTP